jgi:SAM-dependent methyltransferase
MTARRDTEWVRRYWDRPAGVYDRSIAFFERLLLGDARQWLASQAEGDTLEIGVGTGRNLPYYPPSVRLMGADLSREMLGRARERARELGRRVDLREGDAQNLDLPNEAFDTVVFSLALCSIPDDGAAVCEAKRVLRPGGRLLLLEHVRSPRRAVRAVQRVVGFFTERLQGDYMLREPLDHLRREGFAIEALKHSGLGIIERVVARKQH